MKRSTTVWWVAGLAVLLAVAAAAVRLGVSRRPTAAQRLAESDRRFHAEVGPLVVKYCGDCHLDGMTKGDVGLGGLTNTVAFLRDRRLGERVLAVIRSGDMPPKKKEQPAGAERELLVGWLDAALYPLDPENPDPGRVTLRRLNRIEYNNTIRDLVGVDLSPADSFPQDDVGYGFDNIGDVLSLPPVLWERYLRAAEDVLDEAIVDGPVRPRTYRFPPTRLRGHLGNESLATVASNRPTVAMVSVQFPGRYRVRVQAYGQSAADESPRMLLRVDGRELASVEVGNGKGRPKWFEEEVELAVGRRDVAIHFPNDFHAERFVDEKRPNGRVVQVKRVDDRALQVLEVQVVGPEAVDPGFRPESHRRIFAGVEGVGGGGPADAKVAREVIRRFAGRAFRRPVTVEEADRFGGLFDEARRDGESFEGAVRRALTAVLVSPHFLFRGELQPEPDNPKSVHPVDEHALASRLSYFLWSTMPDDELFRLAGEGRLRKGLAGQVRRMLADPKASALTGNFAGQWLQLRLLEVMVPDAVKFPEFDAELREAMRRETELLFEHVVRENRPVSEFLTADYTFVNGRLARHYGMEGVEGAEFVRVSGAGAGRVGVLSHGSILTLTSNPTRTSPVKRGKWVMENVLGTPPPPPPPGVPSLESKELKGTLRRRMEQHRDNAACASCHERMDTIGFAYEHFDAVGRFRKDDEGEAVETAGELPGGIRFRDHAELNGVLAGPLGGSFRRCLVEKMLTYALGRGLEYYDRPAVEGVLKRLEAGGGRFEELILGVVESVPFQKRRGDGEAGGWETAGER